MDINTYKKEASRTMAHLGFLIHDSMHMTIGMNTECSSELLEAFKKSPLDLTNIKEEVGDLMWYIANYANLHSLSLMEHDITTVEFYEKKYSESKEILEDMIIVIGNLQDLDKKLFAYKKPYNTVEQFGYFTHLGLLVLTLCKKLDFDLGKILQANIDKLRARYPEKFTEYHAVNRNLDKERQILEENEI